MGVTASAAASPVAPSRPGRAGTVQPDGRDGEAAKRFGESLGRHAGAPQGDGTRVVTAPGAQPTGPKLPRKSALPSDAAGQGIAADLPTPRRARDEHPAALASATPPKAAAAAPATPPPSNGTPLQPAVEVSVADRLALPEPRGGETRLSFPDAQATARDVLVVQDAGGGLSIDITLRDDRPRDTAATDELRRRLAARGIHIDQIAAQ